jgi:hypothetical protein
MYVTIAVHVLEVAADHDPHFGRPRRRWAEYGPRRTRHEREGLRTAWCGAWPERRRVVAGGGVERVWMLAKPGFTSSLERWTMTEATKRPEEFQKLWREHSAMSVFAVHFATAATAHKKQYRMAVMRNERPRPRACSWVFLRDDASVDFLVLRLYAD